MIQESTNSFRYEGQSPKVTESDAPTIVGTDYIIVGDILNGSYEFSAHKSGRKPRDESFIQQIEIIATRPGAESTTAKVAAVEIQSLIESSIANDPNLGLTERPTLRASVVNFSMNSTQEANTHGWRVVMTLGILIESRLV